MKYSYLIKSYYIKFSFIFSLIMIISMSCKATKVINKKKFNGKITFNIATTIEDEEKFNKELNTYIEKRDSLYKLKHPDDTTWRNINEPTIKLMLDPRINSSQNNSYYKPNVFIYEYKDTLVTYDYEYGLSKYRVEINTLTQDYTKFNLKTNKTVKTKKYKFFNNDMPYQEIVYKDSTKMIHNFNCYKVLIIEDYLDDNLKGLNSYKEMYVTEDINSIYHPLQIRKELLEKYYPLEIKLYSDFLKDKKTKYSIKSIEKTD